jgi:hypothetical protein
MQQHNGMIITNTECVFWVVKVPRNYPYFLIGKHGLFCTSIKLAREKKYFLHLPFQPNKCSHYHNIFLVICFNNCSSVSTSLFRQLPF